MYFMICLAITGSWGTDTASGDWVSTGGGFQHAAEIVLLEADEQHVLIRMDLPGYGIRNTQGFIRFDVPEFGWDLDVPVGHPELPFIPAVIGLPAGMTASVTLLEAEWEPAGTGLAYPVQPLTYDGDQEPFPFAALSNSLNGSYPSRAIALREPGNWAGANTVVVQFNPFSWNSDTNEFIVASSMTARIDFQGSRQFQHTVRPETAAMHRSRIINYDSLNIPVDASPVSSDDNVYICIVPPENLEAVTPLLAMVNALGHHVRIIEMDSGSSSYLVKTAITDAYQPGITRFALIPARHQQLESKNYGSFVGDLYYELIDADNLPDIAVGRYPGNFSQIGNQIEKTMAYVSYAGTPGQPSLSASVILAAHEEGYPGGYTANSNEVKNYNYALADPVFETCYPNEGGTAEQVQNAINTGVGIVNYRGHGSNTTWQWSPGWNAGMIYGLTNTFFPPVFNVCCSNGNHAETYNCLSESWMDGPGTGASGNIGASAPSLTIVNNRMQRVIFWELFDEGNTCAGEMFATSQMDIIQTQGGGGLNNARMYHWFGDPSMDIPNSDLPGTPFPLSVDVPAQLNPGENNLHLTVTSGGSPVEGAVVTVTDGIGNHPLHTETFYAQQFTSSSGEVWLNFTALEGKDLYWGVRLHNHASVTGTIEMTTEGIEGGQESAARLDPVTPSPVSMNAEVHFTAPTGADVNLRVVDIAGRTVSIILDGPVPDSRNSVAFSTADLAPGIYFVVMRTTGFSASERMAVVR